MNTHADKIQEKKSQSVANEVSQKHSGGGATFQFVDNRPEAVVQRRMQEMANSPQEKQAAHLQAMADNHSAKQQHPVQNKEINTGLPNNLKSGTENISGHSMDDVKVHYTSPKPAQLQAHAFAQGNQIHLASGQEKHLPHEAWHVVQQKQGRVKPTVQMKGDTAVNDDPGLKKEADVMGEKALQMQTAKKKLINYSLNTSGSHSLLTSSKNSDIIQAKLAWDASWDFTWWSGKGLLVGGYFGSIGRLKSSLEGYFTQLKELLEKIGQRIIPGSTNLEEYKKSLKFYKDNYIEISYTKGKKLSTELPVQIAGAKTLLKNVNTERSNLPASFDPTVEKEHLDISRAQRIRKYLDSIDTIRVGVQYASGFGHQSAGIAVIQELELLGYTGNIEVVYPASVKKRLESLAPGFETMTGRITYIEEKKFAKEKAVKKKAEKGRKVIGILGAADVTDSSVFLDQLGVSSVLLLQPYAWKLGKRMFSVVKNKQKSKSEDLNLSDGATFIYDVPSPENLKEFVSKELGKGKDVQNKAKSVTEILEETQKGTVELMPMYGLHALKGGQNVETIVANLAAGVSKAQSGRKPAVLLMLSPVKLKIDADSDIIQKASVNSPGFSSVLKGLKPGAVLIADCGGLPQALFRIVFKMATLPSVLEGANTANLVKNLGKSHISVNSTLTPFPNVHKNSTKANLLNVEKAMSSESDEWGEKLKIINEVSSTIFSLNRVCANARDIRNEINKLLTSYAAGTEPEKSLEDVMTELQQSLLANIEHAQQAFPEEDWSGQDDFNAAFQEKYKMSISQFEAKVDSDNKEGYFKEYRQMYLNAIPKIKWYMKMIPEKIELLTTQINAMLKLFSESAKKKELAAVISAEVNKKAVPMKPHTNLQGLDTDINLDIRLDEVARITEEINKAGMNIHKLRESGKDTVMGGLHQKSIDTIANFINESRKPGSETDKYYKAISDDAVSPKNDQLTLGLDALRSTETGDGSYQRGILLRAVQYSLSPLSHGASIDKSLRSKFNRIDQLYKDISSKETGQLELMNLMQELTALTKAALEQAVNSVNKKIGQSIGGSKDARRSKKLLYSLRSRLKHGQSLLPKGYGLKIKAASKSTSSSVTVKTPKWQTMPAMVSGEAEPLPAVNADYLYEYNDIYAIMNLMVAEHNLQNVHVLPAVDNIMGSQLRQRLQEEFAINLNQARQLLIPYNLGNYHWIGIHINITANQQQVTVNVMDSLQNNGKENIKKGTIPSGIASQVRSVYADAVIQTAAHMIQNDSTSCGALTIENLINMARGVNGDENVQVLAGALEIRAQHADRMTASRPQLNFAHRQKHGIYTASSTFDASAYYKGKGNAKSSLAEYASAFKAIQILKTLPNAAEIQKAFINLNKKSSTIQSAMPAIRTAFNTALISVKSGNNKALTEGFFDVLNMIFVIKADNLSGVLNVSKAPVRNISAIENIAGYYEKSGKKSESDDLLSLLQGAMSKKTEHKRNVE